MEISPQQPYQEEPIASQYFDNGEQNPTVIKNSLYGDSVTSVNTEGEVIQNGIANGSLPPGAVGGVAEEGKAKLKKKVKKKKKRKDKLKELLPKYQEKYKDKDEVVLRVDFLR